MITDTINELWLERMNKLADKLEETGDSKLIVEFTNDQLQYLVHWNWGYSGAYKAPETKLAEEELVRRGCPYSSDLAEEVDAIAEQYY